MAQSFDQFCGICKAPRVMGVQFCPQCGNSYSLSGSSSGTSPSPINPEHVISRPTSPVPGTTQPGAVPPPPGGYGPQGFYGSPPDWSSSPPPQKRSSLVRALSIVIAVLVVAVAVLLFLVIGSPKPPVVVSSTPTATLFPSSSPTPTSQPPSPTPPPSNNYTASLPGPGCDTNGGIWTPQGLDGLSCPTQEGTRLVINATGARGYLYLQLPDSKTFSSPNKLNITGTLGGVNSGYQTKCVGLAEQDADTGYVAEYCNDGKWFIYSISSGGTISQTLNKNVINALTGAQISLTLQNTALTFSVNGSVVVTMNIPAFQPTRVAIAYDCVGYGASSTIGGNYLLVSSFSYMQISS